MILEEIKENWSESEALYTHGLKELILMAVLPQWIYRFHEIPIKILAAFFFFAKIDKAIAKFIHK